MPKQASLADRMGSTVFLAALAHGVVILGVTFTVNPLDDSALLPSLNVTLVVDDPSGRTDPDADVLANRGRRGSGAAADGRRATTELPANQALNHLGDPFGADATDGTPEDRRRRADQLLAHDPSAEPQRTVPDAAEAPADSPSKAITLIEHATTPSLAAELDLSTTLPNRNELDDALASPSTRESAVAEYLLGWRQRVERIGTAHFPKDFVEFGNAGRPTLEVTIGPGGQLEEIVVRRSSGNKRLDQAALNILRLAAPFEPLPNTVLAGQQTLRVAYEWDFSRGDEVIVN